jgi:ABC-2 type transport system permease protein
MSLPASWPRATLAQVRMEGRLTARRGENVLALIGIPAAVLLFFGSVDLVPVPAGQARVDVLLPGTLALAIIAAGLVNLGIATAYERAYGVLKRLGGSPLGRTGLIVAKLLTVIIVEIAVVAVLVAIAVFVFGWRPGPGASAPAFVAAFLVGTAAFAGLGLALAGTLRAEATLTLANALFIACLLLGGVVVPVDHLPDALAAVSRLLPAAALAEAFRAALGGGGELGRSLAVVGAWAVGALVVAFRWFRWE